MAGARSSVPEMHGDAVVGMTGRDPHRSSKGAALVFQLQHVLGVEVELLRSSGTDPRGVVPGHFVLRLGQFLEPAVVGPRSIPDGGIGPEDNLQTLDRRGLTAGRGFGGDVDGGKRAVRNYAIVQRLLPEHVEVGLTLPILLDQLVSGFVRLTGECCDHFVRVLAAVERRDERLDEADGSVVAADIAPRFQIVRFGNVPVH